MAQDGLIAEAPALSALLTVIDQDPVSVRRAPKR